MGPPIRTRTQTDDPCDDANVAFLPQTVNIKNNRNYSGLMFCQFAK